MKWSWRFQLLLVVIFGRNIKPIFAFTEPANSRKDSSSRLEPPIDAAATAFLNSPPPITRTTIVDEEEKQQRIIISSSPFKKHLTTTSAATATIDIGIGIDDTTKKTATLPLYQLALAGAIATALGDAVVHPIDCIKTIQQSDEYIGATIPQAITILWNTNNGFYRGLGTYLCADATAGAIKFATYETILSLSGKQQQHNNNHDDDVQQQNSILPLVSSLLFLLAPAIAFLASSLVLVPGEFIKQQLQMGHYTSLQDAITTIWSSEKGPLGFYTGYAGVCWRDIPYTIMELSLYNWLKDNNNNKEKTTSVTSSKYNDDETILPLQEEGLPSSSSLLYDDLRAGAITGGIGGFITTPLDTIKTKLMVDSEYYGDDFLSCMLDTVNEHGITYLFCGSIARIIWLLPFTAIYLPLFDTIKRTFLVWNNDDANKYEGEINKKSFYSILDEQ